MKRFSPRRYFASSSLSLVLLAAGCTGDIGDDQQDSAQGGPGRREREAPIPPWERPTRARVQP